MATPNYLEIPRVSTLTLDQYRKTFATIEQPVIVESFADVRSWPVFQSWSFERLQREYGSLEVAPRVNFPDPDRHINVFELTSNEYPPKQKMLMREFIDRVCDPASAKSPIYLQTSPESRALMEAMVEFRRSWDFSQINPDPEGDVSASTHMWIGSEGTRAGFHQDDRNNFLVQAIGRKRVYLGSPFYTSCFYPFPGIPDKSQIAPDDMDEARFPRMKRAVLLTGVIAPGEVLYIPRGWWHSLRSLEPNIMLNFWHGQRLTPADFELMYESLGLSYELAKRREFARTFAKTMANMLRGRKPLDGLPVWFMPGAAAAINLVNAYRGKRRSLRTALGLPVSRADEPVSMPFFYP